MFTIKDLKFQKYFKKAIEYGEASAFLIYGFALANLGRFKEAHEMFQNSYHYGCKTADITLGEILSFSCKEFQFNPQFSVFHYERAIKNGIKLDIFNQRHYTFMKRLVISKK